MNPLAKSRLGNTWLEVPKLGLGGTALGGLFHDLSDDTATKTVKNALRMGIDFFDTAPLYGAGKSESRFKLGLEGVNRNSYVLASKVGYSLVPHDPGTADCQAKGASIIIGGPYNSGILATGAVPGAMYNYVPADAAILERVRRIETVCKEYSVPLQAAALQFPLAHPVVKSIIPGARSVEEVEENFRFVSHPIPAEFWAELRKRNLLPQDAPVPGA